MHSTGNDYVVKNVARYTTIIYYLQSSSASGEPMGRRATKFKPLADEKQAGMNWYPTKNCYRKSRMCLLEDGTRKLRHFTLKGLRKRSKVSSAAAVQQ